MKSISALQVERAAQSNPASANTSQNISGFSEYEHHAAAAQPARSSSSESGVASQSSSSAPDARGPISDSQLLAPLSELDEHARLSGGTSTPQRAPPSQDTSFASPLAALAALASPTSPPRLRLARAQIALVTPVAASPSAGHRLRQHSSRRRHADNSVNVDAAPPLPLPSQFAKSLSEPVQSTEACAAPTATAAASSDPVAPKGRHSEPGTPSPVSPRLQV